MGDREDRRKLKEHQEVLREMLGVIDGVCRESGISYSLFAGSALGAVRHQGFIPWDDDLDVIMLRPEYEKFMRIAPEKLPERYFMQSEFSEHWPCPFSKLRKNGTACIERLIPKDPDMHQGIYIDVFPCDNLSDNHLVRGLQFAASKIVIGKSLWQRGYLTDSLLKKVFVQVCRLFPKRKLAAFVRMEGKVDTEMVHAFFAASSKYSKSVFPREWFTETVMMPFEGGTYPVSAHWDELLTTLYGDYMTPPPPEERERKVHAEIVDTENSYEIYRDIQRDLKFSSYTRSIR